MERILYGTIKDGHDKIKNNLIRVLHGPFYINNITDRECAISYKNVVSMLLWY